MGSSATFLSTPRGVALLARGLFVALVPAVLLMLSLPLVWLVEATPPPNLNLVGGVAYYAVGIVMLGILLGFFEMGWRLIPRSYEVGDGKLIARRVRGDLVVPLASIATLEVVEYRALIKQLSGWAFRASTPSGFYFQAHHGRHGDLSICWRGQRHCVLVAFNGGWAMAFSPDDAVGFAVALERAIASDGERPSTPIGRSTA